MHEVETALSGAVEQMQRAGDLIAAIRKLASKAPDESHWVDVAGVVEPVLKLALVDLEANSVALSYRDLRHGPHLWADVRAQEIGQIVLNLISNSLDAFSAGQAGKEIAVEIFEDGQDICVTVADNGPGIPSDQTSRIFDSFFTSKPSGIGLGLKICRDLAESHGGSLDCLENHGKNGATFCLRLPGYTK